MTLRLSTISAVICLAVTAHAPAQDNETRTRHTITGYEVWSLNVSRPQQLGVSFGRVFALPNHPFLLAQHGPSGIGILGEAEIATGGAKLAVGLHSNAGMGSLSPRIALLRTWGNPWGVPPNQTLLGPELVIRFVVVRLSVGYLLSTSGHAGQTMLGLGVGF